MSDPIILVCGFGRCGSSLTLQMLAAGGMPVVGEAPAFEPKEMRPMQSNNNKMDFLKEYSGWAIKLLDPHRFILPNDLSYRPIWLTRDKREQAKSQRKFMRMLMGIPVPRSAIGAIERSYIDDKPAAIRSLFAAGPTDILEVHFEHLIGRQCRSVAKEIAGFVGRELDIDAMTRVVRLRGPECQPGLDIELSLIAEKERANAL